MSRFGKRLLVVDWDFFFPMHHHPDPQWQLFDWGHSEHNPLYFDMIWHGRAAGFLRNNLPLPTVENTAGFWRRFNFRKTTKLHISDSNVRSWNTSLFRDLDYVLLFDAHHDSGYQWPDLPNDERVGNLMDQGRVTCEDWMVPYGLAGVQLEHRYPTWRTGAFDEEPPPMVDVWRHFDDGGSVGPVFDYVSICRSSAWVPPWCDDAFDQFCKDSNLLRRTIEPLYERTFDPMQAVREAAQMRELMERGAFQVPNPS